MSFARIFPGEIDRFQFARREIRKCLSSGDSDQCKYRNNGKGNSFHGLHFDVLIMTDTYKTDVHIKIMIIDSEMQILSL